MIILSRYFQLTDPAIILEATPDRVAQAGSRPRHPNPPLTRERGLEQIEIAFGGKAGEMLLEEVTKSEGRLIQLHTDSTADDFNVINGAAEYWEAEDQRDALFASARQLVEENRQAWEDIANLAIQSMGKKPSLSKLEVESLPSVQALLQKKRPE